MSATASHHRTKLGIIGMLPSYYQDVIWRKLAAAEELDVTVVYLSDVGLRSDFVDKTLAAQRDWSDRVDLSAYRHTFVRNFGSQHIPGPLSRINPTLAPVLLRERFDVILLPSHKTLSTLGVALGCIAARTPVIYRAEAVVRPGPESLLRRANRLFDRAVLKNFDIVMYSCTGNRNWFESRGVPSDRLMLIPCAVDNEFYQSQRLQWQPQRDATRASMGVAADDLVVTYLGTLTPWKRIVDIVGSAAALRDKFPTAHRRTHWLIIGEGPERSRAEALISEHHLENVKLVGYQGQEILGKWLSASDVGMVLSDVDRSPKALNEMGNFGLPLICTEPVGTAFDLVRPGRNGYVVPLGDVGAVAAAVNELLLDSAKRRAFGAASLELVSRWSFDADVAAIRAAVERIRSARVLS